MDGEWFAAGASALEARDELDLAVRTVEGFEPREAIQAGARREVLDFTGSHPDALHRSCLDGHLTGSAWVVDHTGGHGLVLMHAKVGRWLQPGGHADGDGCLPSVALREAAEETGIDGLEVWSRPIDVDVHLFVNRKGTEPDHLHFDVRFLVRAPQGAVVRGNEESEALRWIGPGDLDDSQLGLDDSTRRLARHGFALAAELGTVPR